MSKNKSFMNQQNEAGQFSKQSTFPADFKQQNNQNTKLSSEKRKTADTSVLTKQNLDYVALFV